MYDFGIGTLLGACKDAPFSEVKALHVHSRIPSFEQWQELFSTMDGVLSLQIQDLPNPALLQALYSRRIRPEDDLMSRLVMSRLHTLKFDGCCFSEAGVSESAEGEEEPLFHLLLSLEHRHAGDMRLQRIVLNYCTVATSAHLDAVKGIAHDVDCAVVRIADCSQDFGEGHCDARFRRWQRARDETGLVYFGLRD